ncbi:MAG: hypothetical protein ACLUHE_05420 [Christensenellales bacterium]
MIAASRLCSAQLRIAWLIERRNRRSGRVYADRAAWRSGIGGDDHYVTPNTTLTTTRPASIRVTGAGLKTDDRSVSRNSASPGRSKPQAVSLSRLSPTGWRQRDRRQHANFRRVFLFGTSRRHSLAITHVCQPVKKRRSGAANSNERHDRLISQPPPYDVENDIITLNRWILERHAVDFTAATTLRAAVQQICTNKAPSIDELTNKRAKAHRLKIEVWCLVFYDSRHTEEHDVGSHTRRRYRTGD